MKIQYMSDVHNEMNSTLIYQKTDADVVILAGDIDIGSDGLRWAMQNIQNKPVLYVVGNHEYYGQTIPNLVEEMKRECAGTNVQILEKDVEVINGVNFLGCSLWTDFNYNNEVLRDQALCEALISDYTYIRDGITTKKITAKRIVEIHRESLAWLEQTLANRQGQTNVVITHHAPDGRTIPSHRSHNLTAAYVTRLESFILNYKPAAWVHGHIHEISDFKLGDCHILCNPRGYDMHWVKGFDVSKTHTVI